MKNHTPPDGEALKAAIVQALPAAQAALRCSANDDPRIIVGLCLTMYAQVCPTATEEQDLMFLREFRKLATEQQLKAELLVDFLSGVDVLAVH